MRLLQVAVALVILILAGLAGYAYFGDMRAEPHQMRLPVELDLDAPAPPTGGAPGGPTPAAPVATPAPAGQDDLD